MIYPRRRRRREDVRANGIGRPRSSLCTVTSSRGYRRLAMRCKYRNTLQVRAARQVEHGVLGLDAYAHVEFNF
ncbi:hypothetical protein EXIGLDRAFT_337536 [Exidia glandulosa HHB12029]|uniref:Uncharacterized protein n=1 Tax=Exidia glandulosa HHB12029 TaxID=1314781 RepID=A0A165LIY8_EXIGL|nr:hypothetical protein EXIGLDRAFT_337536 [Exidia glandulosa HHB12029]